MIDLNVQIIVATLRPYVDIFAQQGLPFDGIVMFFTRLPLYCVLDQCMINLIILLWIWMSSICVFRSDNEF